MRKGYWSASVQTPIFRTRRARFFGSQQAAATSLEMKSQSKQLSLFRHKMITYIWMPCMCVVSALACCRLYKLWFIRRTRAAFCLADMPACWLTLHFICCSALQLQLRRHCCTAFRYFLQQLNAQPAAGDSFQFSGVTVGFGQHLHMTWNTRAKDTNAVDSDCWSRNEIKSVSPVNPQYVVCSTHTAHLFLCLLILCS